MEMQRRIYGNDCGRLATRLPLVTERLAVGSSVTGALRETGREGTMRQVTHLHRTLVVLAVGLLALAAPLVAYADGGPAGG